MLVRGSKAHEALGWSSRFRQHLKSLIKDRSGNFAMMFALTAVPVMIAVGCSLDYVQAMNTHRKMQADLDAAIVAAVQHVGTKDDTAIKAEIGKWLEAEAETKGYYVLNTSGIVIDSTNSTIKASVSATVPTTFLKIAGINSVPVSVQAAVLGGKNSTTKNAFSMYLVLDRSGSMGYSTATCKVTRSNGTCKQYYTKIESLKMAADMLLTQFDTADPEMKYVRTGAVSYDRTMQTPTPLAWGTSAVKTYVSALTPGSTTNSGEAFQKAYESLVAGSENTAHANKNGNNEPSKYIVFMTDGENNVAGADTKTKQYCDKARNAEPQIRVYSIAFMAPAAGQALLKYCATNPEDYFPAENTAELVTAFKLIGESSAKTLTRLTQ